MVGNLVVVTEERLELIIQNAIDKALTKGGDLSKEQSSQAPPVVYHTREQVKDILHTTYPTLQKYTDSGLLNATYFGRRVLYRDDELNLALPRIRTIQAKRKKKLLVV